MRLKHRLIGASVVVIVAVIFLPELLRPAADRQARVVEMEIPEPPVHTFEPMAPVPAFEDQQTVPMGSAEAPTGSAVAGATAVTGGHRADEPDRVSALRPKVPATEESDSPPAELRSWVVQVGSFSQKANAMSLRDQLRQSGFTTFVEDTEVQGRVLFRVRVGPELERAAGERLKDRLSSELKLNGQLTRYP